MSDDFKTKPKVDESSVEILYQHWLRFGFVLIGLAVLFVVPFFFLWPLFKLGYLGLIIFGILVATVIVLMFREYYKWTHTTIVITTKRIIITHQKALFNSVTAEIALDTLSDVEEHRKGFWQTVSGYGTLILRSVGRTEPLYVPYVGNPGRVRGLLLELRDSASGTNNATGEWWWDRFIELDHQEQHELLAKIYASLGDDRWREIFRPHNDNEE